MTYHAYDSDSSRGPVEYNLTKYQIEERMTDAQVGKEPTEKQVEIIRKAGYVIISDKFDRALASKLVWFIKNINVVGSREVIKIWLDAGFIRKVTK